MAERLTFVLSGRDDLSRVLGHAGDSAIRLRDQMEDAADGSGQAILTLTRDADGRLRDLQGQFVSTGDAARLMASQVGGARAPIADWSDAMDRGRRTGAELAKVLISLAPAAIPAAAALAPIAAGTAAAGLATIAYVAALAPQIAALSEAAEAEKKYEDAVEKSGARSEEAVKAHAEYVRQMAKLPPETREAAAAVGILKDEFKDWSDATAGATMVPVTKGMAVMGALLPRLTPMVRSMGSELDRTMTLAAGGMETPGFDRFMGKVNTFVDRGLQRANDGLVSFLNKTDTGEVGGGISRFMDYARAQGPMVGDTLRNIGDALFNVLEAGSEVGVSMLTAVNVLTGIVAAVPPGAIALLLQLAIAIRLVRLAAIGLGAARAMVAAFGASVLAMQAAATGATGRMAALTASFGAMSRGARMAVAGTGIGLLVIALSELMSIGQEAPADMDAMTSSIAQLGRTGKVSGEAARILGSDLGELEKSLRTLARPSNYESSVQWLGQLIGMDSTPVKVAKEQLGALDGALAQLVKNGNPALAEAALKKVAAGLGNLTEGELRTQLTGYKQALADVAFEQRLIAESQGLFGQQALATKGKLDAQKASADGLRQAIQALNDVNRAGLSGMIGFEAAIDAATKAASENAGSLRMVNGTLDLSSEKSRTAAGALNDLAAKTDEAAGSARENGASWSTVNGIYDKGRQKLIASAMQMGLTRQQASALAAQILKTPDKTAKLKGNMQDLAGKLAEAKKRLANVPDSRKAAVRAEIADLEAKIRIARAQLEGLDGKTATTYINTVYSSANRTRIVNGVAVRAQGGIVRRSAGGPVRGPGTETSDSILTALSNNEYVIKARSVAKYGEPFLDAVNAGRFSMAQVAPSAAMRMPTPGHAAPAAGSTVVQQFHITVNGAVDAMSTGQQLETLLEKYRRNKGGGQLTFVRS